MYYFNHIYLFSRRSHKEDLIKREDDVKTKNLHDKEHFSDSIAYDKTAYDSALHKHGPSYDNATYAHV